MNRQLKKDRGYAMIYAALVIVILAALLAFAIDLGRVHLVKSQLQATADAAAHAAVWSVPNQDLTGSDSTSAYSVAKTVASENVADGSGVVLDTTKGDVVIGYWSPTNKTFTAAKSQSDYQQSNAVQVTANRSAARSDAVQFNFSAAVNGPSSTDLTATATAMIFGTGTQSNGHGYGVFGKQSVSLNGNTFINGGVASDGSINMVGGSTIQGDARWGPEGSPYSPSPPTGDVTGYVARLSSMLNYPSVAAPTSFNNTPIGLSNSTTSPPDLSFKKTFNVPAGTYYVNSISGSSANANLNITSGPVIIYVKNSVSLKGNVTVSGNVAANLTINVMPSSGSSVDLQGNSSLYAHLYAPDSSVTLGASSINGWIIGSTVSLKGNGTVTYDGTNDSTGNPGDGAFSVELVK
jgi:Flp pilus assembly protein TadG